MTTPFVLKDQYNLEDGPQVRGEMTVANGTALFRFDEFGDFFSSDGHGHPVLIELVGGKLRVVVWDDINSEDATIIDLSKAREDNRAPETE